jgi:glycosyltransferase involved in cell wall biosynthesis
MKYIKVSVCMATYNGEKYIKEQIASILCQLSEEDEIIISDDGSTDKTIETIQSFGDGRIKIYHHEKNKNPLSVPAASFRLATQNFENAVNQANGDYIYFADQDDIWLPNRMETMQRELQNYDLVMCNYKVIDDNGNIIKEKFHTANPVGNFFKNLRTTPFLGCCMAFKRSVLSYCLPFPENCIGHDFWMGCLIVHLGTFKFIEKPLHLYRKHSLNVSPATEASKNPLWFKISYRLSFVYHILNYSINYKYKKRK